MSKGQNYAVSKWQAMGEVAVDIKSTAVQYRNPLSMTLYGCPRPKVPCTAEVKVLLDSLVPVSEPR